VQVCQGPQATSSLRLHPINNSLTSRTAGADHRAAWLPGHFVAGRQILTHSDVTTIADAPWLLVFGTQSVTDECSPRKTTHPERSGPRSIAARDREARTLNNHSLTLCRCLASFDLSGSSSLCGPLFAFTAAATALIPIWLYCSARLRSRRASLSFL